MKVPFRHSKFVSGKTRHNRQDRKHISPNIEKKRGEEAEANRQEQKAYNVALEQHNRDQEVQRDIARLLLRNEGIHEPQAPNAAECLPDPKDIENAAMDGLVGGVIGGVVAAAGMVPGPIGAVARVVAVSVGSGVVSGVGVAVLSDNRNAEQCLKEQDEEHKEAVDQYEQFLRELNPNYGREFVFSPEAQARVQSGIPHARGPSFGADAHINNRGGRPNGGVGFKIRY